MQFKHFYAHVPAYWPAPSSAYGNDPSGTISEEKVSASDSAEGFVRHGIARHALFRAGIDWDQKLEQ